MMMTPTTTSTGCICTPGMGNVGGGGSIGNGNSVVGTMTGTGNAIGGGGGISSNGGNPNNGAGVNINVNGGAAYNDDATTSNAETLLSSNAKFQAISAIAVAQDGVINVADQGMCFKTIIIILYKILYN